MFRCNVVLDFHMILEFGSVSIKKRRELNYD